MGVDLSEEPRLDGQNTLLGIEHFGLDIFHFGGDVALGIDQRLLSNVVLGHIRGVGFGDFDVVAMDLVVADLEGFNAGAGAFFRFEIGDPLAGIA